MSEEGLQAAVIGNPAEPWSQIGYFRRTDVVQTCFGPKIGLCDSKKGLCFVALLMRYHTVCVFGDKENCSDVCRNFIRVRDGIGHLRYPNI
jgi:hypothetical protein